MDAFQETGRTVGGNFGEGESSNVGTGTDFAWEVGRVIVWESVDHLLEPFNAYVSDEAV